MIFMPSTYSSTSYIGTVYLLTSTVFLPLFASLADVWGRHWALQFSLFLFMLGSAISTGSQNMATMLAGRGVAGIGAGGMMAVRSYALRSMELRSSRPVLFAGRQDHIVRLEVFR